MEFPKDLIEFNYAKTQNEANILFNLSKMADPLPDIKASLLNKRDIAKYVSATGMVYPFHPESLKAASYEVKVGREVLYWDKDDKKHHKIELKDTDSILFKKNSITFVSVEPKFLVPFYIALRFNLSITHVHRGLLLGTGPLIDPTFIGRIMIPIHNLTNNDYFVRPGDDLIAVEFTKIWFDETDEHNINFEKMSRNVKKADLSFDDYFKMALPEGINSVQSSLEQTVEKAKGYVVQSEAHINKIKEESLDGISKIKSEADKSRFIFTIVGIISAVALVATIMAVFFQTKSVVSDANNYVANSSNLLQGSIKKAYDPEGFEQAIDNLRQEIIKSNHDMFEEFYNKQKISLDKINQRIESLSQAINDVKTKSEEDKLKTDFEIDEIKKELVKLRNINKIKMNE